MGDEYKRFTYLAKIPGIKKYMPTNDQDKRKQKPSKITYNTHDQNFLQCHRSKDLYFWFILVYM